MKKNIITGAVIVVIAAWIVGSFVVGSMNAKKQMNQAQEVTSGSSASKKEKSKSMEEETVSAKTEENKESTSVSNGDNLKENSQVESGINPGQKAIDFTLLNSAGEEVSLSDFQGKKVLVNFWASWCPPCRAEMPEFEEFAKENPDIVILGVNIDVNNQEDASDKAVEELGVTYPIVYGTQQLAGVYQVQSIPMNLFIDEKGVIQQKLVGGITKDVLIQEFSKY